MPNPENLTVPQKGEVRNPSGRPKGAKNRATIIKAILDSKATMPDQIYKNLEALFPDLARKMTVEELITWAQINRAINKHDTAAYKALMDSAYGAPKQEVENNINLNGKPPWLGTAAAKRDVEAEATGNAGLAPTD